MRVDNVNYFFDHFLLDKFVDQTILGHLRTGVHFNKTAAAIAVYHDVLAEQFKAIRVIRYMCIGSHQCFDHNIAHLWPDLRLKV